MNRHSKSVEQINPYRHDQRGKAAQVQQMFDNIAPAYDFMNRAMTLGIDRRWRRIAVSRIPKRTGLNILDIATGTGDMAILIRRMTGARHITGIDLSQGMISEARRKVSLDPTLDGIEFMLADSLDTPFPDNSFDAITVAYGVRNFADIRAGYAEMFRILKPGGMLIVLELSTPRNPLIKPLYNLYTHTLIPLAGRLVAHGIRAYSYLPESIAAVPQSESMTAIMHQAGFPAPRFRTLTFGVCTLYTAGKPI